MSKHTFDDLPEYLVPIEHSAIGTTWAKKAHKYIAKIGNKYYYDARELAAATGKKVNNFVTGKDSASELASAKRANSVATSNARLSKNSTARKYGVMTANRTSNAAVNNAKVRSTQQRLAKAQSAYNRTLPGMTKKVKKNAASVLNKLGVAVNHNKTYGTVKSAVNNARYKVNDVSKKLKNRTTGAFVSDPFTNLKVGTTHKYTRNGKTTKYKKVLSTKSKRLNVGR